MKGAISSVKSTLAEGELDRNITLSLDNTPALLNTCCCKGSPFLLLIVTARLSEAISMSDTNTPEDGSSKVQSLHKTSDTALLVQLKVVTNVLPGSPNTQLVKV